jgi:hypothetical protein
MFAGVGSAGDCRCEGGQCYFRLGVRQGRITRTGLSVMGELFDTGHT